MANMTAKHGTAQFQCSCCDRKGRVRRAGRKSAKQRERREWKRDHERGQA